MIERRFFVTAQKLRKTILQRSKGVSRLSRHLGDLLTRRYNARKIAIATRICKVENSGWHFSSIGSWESFRQKVDAYAHPEYKKYRLYHEKTAYLKHIEAATKQVDIEMLPRHVLENRYRFSSILYTGTMIDGQSSLSTFNTDAL